MNFEKIFIISSPTSHRREQILRTLDAFSCDYEFVWYYDNILRLHEGFTKYFAGDFSLIENDEIIQRNFSLSLHHILCYEKILEQNLSTALVLEDDCLIDDLSVKEIKLPEEWDCISLEKGCLDFSRIPREIFRSKTTNCTAALLVNKKWCREFINWDKTDRHILPIDHMMNGFVDKMKFYCTTRFLFKQSSVIFKDSTINQYR